MSIRLEIDEPNQALHNMRKDEVLYRALEAGETDRAHLRFYSWQRPAVTFGYAQVPDKLIDTARAQKLGVETARRITGGGLVFHQPNELTYCLVAPLAALPAGIIPSCNFISEIFIKALNKIGIPAELAASAGFACSPAGGYARDICFARPTKYEVVCRGKKLIGSAQKRGRIALLQQGSLPLEPLLPVFAEFTDIEKLKRSTANIQECLADANQDRRQYTYQELAALAAEEFQAVF